MKNKISAVVAVSLDALKPNPKNPNKHTPAQIKRLAKIIKRNGWRHPIIVSKTSELIVVGHGRLEAAKLLGLEKVPVAYQEFDDADEEYQFMVADNAIADWSNLDFSAINFEVPNLGPDFDVDLLGINGFEIDIVDKSNGDNEGHKQIKKVTCPECGHVWDANSILD
jgi:hypothetical protein